MKQYRIAILGATGAVGQEMLHLLLTRNIPYTSIRLFASSKSKGKQITMHGHVFTVEETTKDSFIDIDILLGAANNEIAKTYLPIALENNVFVVDNSSAYRLDPSVPLIIPEINAHKLKDAKGLVANPNCATILALCAIYPLYQLEKIKNITVSTYQAVSGAGIQGIQELEEQIQQLSNKQAVNPHIFQKQIAYNLIPQIGDFNEFGISSEEQKMYDEGRKILDDPDFQSFCTCVRVPVYRSHSESIRIQFQKPVSMLQAKQALLHAKGIQFMEHSYPTPLDASNQDLVLVGRLRQDPFDPCVLHLWCCGDQIRKGAATNAIQIVEEWIQLDQSR